MYKQIYFPTIEDEPQKQSGLSFTAVVAIFCVIVLAGIIFYKANQDKDDNIVPPIAIIPQTKT